MHTMDDDQVATLSRWRDQHVAPVRQRVNRCNDRLDNNWEITAWCPEYFYETVVLVVSLVWTRSTTCCWVQSDVWSVCSNYIQIIHMHTCTHAHMHTCTHAHMHTCTHAHMHTCTHAHMHTCTHAHMHTCTHAHMHTCTHAHMHTCTHAHMHTCTHAHIHTWTVQYRSVRGQFRTLLKLS